MIHHAVYLPPDATADQAELANIMTELAALVGVIDGFQSFHHGPDIDLEDKSPEAAVLRYANDPRHQAPGGGLVALCGGQARAGSIVEPWEENSKTFANGAVGVALLDSIEPAAAFYLLTLHPPYDEVGGRSCTVVGLDDGLGYAAVFFSELGAGYDPAKGLILRVAAIIYLPEQSFQNAARLTIAVNQSSGEVSVYRAGPRE